MSGTNNTLNILEIFLKNPHGMKLNEISTMSGCSVSTVHRIVTVLAKKEYLYQKNKRGAYFLGPKFFEFNDVAKSSMKFEDLAHYYLKKINNSLNEYVELAILKGNKALVIDNISDPTDRILKVLFREGREIDLYCTSSGKIFLSDMSKEELDKYFQATAMVSHTQNTITDSREFIKQLTVIKQEGVAFSFQEFENGINGVSAPVKDKHGSVMATVTIIGLSLRFNKRKMKKAATVVKSYALEISKTLGYNEE